MRLSCYILINWSYGLVNEYLLIIAIFFSVGEWGIAPPDTQIENPKTKKASAGE